MQPQAPYGAAPATPSPPRPGGLAQILSIVAVLLAAAALVVSFAIPGPTGPAGAAGANGTNGTSGTNGATGPRGPTGPQGNGTLMVTNQTGATFITIGTSCTNAGLQVNITVPTSGTVVVQGSTRMRINHVVGTEDRWLIAIGTLPTDCPILAWSWLDSIGTNEPTQASDWVSAYAQNVFPVTAGTHRYFFNGYMVSGGDANDVFIYANMVAVFYPG